MEPERLLQIYKDAKNMHDDLLDTIKNTVDVSKRLYELNLQQGDQKKLHLLNKETVREFIEFNDSVKTLFSNLSCDGKQQLQEVDLKKHYQDLEQTQAFQDKLNQIHRGIRELCSAAKRIDPIDSSPEEIGDENTQSTNSATSTDLDFTGIALAASSPLMPDP